MDRVETGIPGLDTILNGGLFKGGVYIVEGAPGSGKMIELAVFASEAQAAAQT